MEKSASINKVVAELDNCLTNNNLYDSHESAVNHNILVQWGERFRSAITTDIQSKFNDIEINFVYSKFEMKSEDNHGACLFFHKVIIRDRKNTEFIEAFIKILVNLNIASIYLASRYAALEKWMGESQTLTEIFDKLKVADRKTGFFNPPQLADFIA